MAQRAIALLVFELAVLLAAPSAGAGIIDLEIAPRGVRIGSFFAGRTIELAGSVDPSVDVVIEVVGPEEDALFHLKGRVGPLWLNVAEVDLKFTPHLYLLLTSNEMPSGEGLEEFGLGLEHVETKMALHPTSLDKDEIFEQFLKLKRSQGLYAEHYGAIGYDPAIDGRRGFHAELFLPSSTAPGVYRIVATGLAEGRVVDHTVQDLWVAEVGLIKIIHDLSVEHDLIYGVACVIVALIVGGLVGVVFKRAGAH
jgi:uncharacterized protein (TIGR02186 family)